MSQGLPKSVREVLLRQTPTPEHLSADLLNGYVEQSLSAGEKDRVANHLAACEECREVVFLARAAVEEPAFAAVAAAAVAQPAAQPTSPPETRRPWWRLAVGALALAIVAGVLIRHQHQVSTQPASQSQLAINRQAAPPSEPASSVPPESLTATAESEAQLDSREQKKSPPEKRRTSPPLPAQLPSSTASSQDLNTLAASRMPPEADLVPKGLPSTEQAPSPPATAKAPMPAVVTTPQKGTTMHAFAGASRSAGLFSVRRNALQWRITADGHLERWQSEAWTRALADQPVVFRAVATVGSYVWAGGNGGALFYSVDGGDSWNKVALAADGVAELGAITSIQFDTATQGTLTTDSGATWETSNGGQSWTKQ